MCDAETRFLWCFGCEVVSASCIVAVAVKGGQFESLLLSSSAPPASMAMSAAW